jgi:hypothetical protein
LRNVGYGRRDAWRLALSLALSGQGWRRQALSSLRAVLAGPAASLLDAARIRRAAAAFVVAAAAAAGAATAVALEAATAV